MIMTRKGFCHLIVPVKRCLIHLESERYAYPVEIYCYSKDFNSRVVLPFDAVFTVVLVGANF